MVLDELLITIVTTLNTELTLKYPVEIGRLDKDGSIKMQLVPSSPTTTFLNKKIENEILILFLCKDKEQLACLQQLDNIKEYLVKLTTYPNLTNSEWVNSYISTEIDFVEQEDNGNYIYSMIIGNKIIQ